jgi:hypothetical protein
LRTVGLFRTASSTQTEIANRRTNPRLIQKSRINRGYHGTYAQARLTSQVNTKAQCHAGTHFCHFRILMSVKVGIG